MDEPEVTTTEEIITPTGEETTPEEAVTTEVSATPEPEEEPLVAIDESATPEERVRQEKINFSYAEQRRKRREAEQKQREIELQLAEERGRREAIERFASTRQEAPVQKPEAQLPPLQLPPRPDSSLWTDEDGYEDQDRKMEILADWRADCKLAERDRIREQREFEKEQLALQEKAMNFINSVNSKYPDFAELSRHTPQPSDNVMAFILGTENSEKVAYYLAKNPAEIGRLNGMQLKDAAIHIGRLDARMGIAAPPAKTTPSAPAPIQPVTPSGALSARREDMSIEDWMAARDREEFGERT